MPLTPKPDPVNELVVLVRSRLGLIALDAGDPEQAHDTLAVAAAQLGIPLFFWTRTKGLRRKDVGTAVYGTVDSIAAFAHIEAAHIPAIYEFEGLGTDLSDPTRAQRLKDAIAGLNGLDAAIVLLDGADSLPDPLRQLAALVTLPPPSVPAISAWTLGTTREPLPVTSAMPGSRSPTARWL